MVLQHSSVGNPYIGINLLCHANVGISQCDSEGTEGTEGRYCID